jgi:hypothetical protein
MALNYMKLGRWMRDHRFVFPVLLPTREDIFRHVAGLVADRRVLYLEFGVYEGRSMEFWSRALLNPASSLHGFDSFEGLPEPFDDAVGRYKEGHFDLGGRQPDIADPRVRFFRGWFDQTLPNYEPPEHDVLVVTMDADLYSSTMVALRALRPYFRPGTYLYFDDLSRPEHEARAFDEFMQESGLRFGPFAAEVTLNRAVFICEGEALAPESDQPEGRSLGQP